MSSQNSVLSTLSWLLLLLVPLVSTISISCSDDSFENSFGRCEVKRKYSEPCSKAEECRRDSHPLLGCWNGSCSCEPSQSTWSNVYINVPAPIIVKSGKCVSKATAWARGIQSPYYPKTYNYREDCSWTISVAPRQIIQLTMLHHNSQCPWDDAHVYDGSPATRLASTICHQNQTTTTVQSTRNQLRVVNVNSGWRAKIEVIEPERFECVGLANKDCSPSLNCVRDAQCSGQGKCLCMENYAATSNGACALSYGQLCDANEEICSDSFTCSKGKCACRHLRQIYSDGRDKCTSFVSGPCASAEDCVDGTFCNFNAKTGLGFCECEVGRVENYNWTCDLAHGSVCRNLTDVCDTVAGLECRNGLCSCPDDSMLFSSKQQMCLGLAHFRCSKDDACVEHAECVVLRKGLRGVCKCKHGFEETRDRTCVPTLLPPNSTVGSTAKAAGKCSP